MQALHRRTHPQDVEGCFGCKAVGFGLIFPYGRETFHDTTINETLADMHKRAAENGREIEKV